jgi:hypothetical protein
MSVSASFRRDFLGQISIAATVTKTADANNVIDDSIAGNTTNRQILFAIDVSELQAIVIFSDSNITVKTNSSSSPTDTISILAGIPYIWVKDEYETCKITADVTALFVTNANASAASFKMITLYNT